MMTNISIEFAKLADHEVLRRLDSAVRDEREATAQLIALLMEVDSRRLYLGAGYSSLFTYCTQVLHLSEHAAYNRIETARAARRFPMILDAVESGAVTLTTVRLLAPHLTAANHADVLDRARHKSKREVELLVASLSPRPDVPSVVRKLPTVPPKADVAEVAPAAVSVAAELEVPRPIQASPSVPSKPAVMQPLTPARYKLQVTVSREAYDKLWRAQDLLRHRVPNGDPAIILERALDVLVAELERAKAAVTPKPRAARETKPGSRHVSAVVRRAVWDRDGGRCAFTGTYSRCTETGFLECHHVVPFADGGATSVSNLELRCRAHNQHEADLWFGAAETPRVREDRPSFGGSPARSGTSSWTPQIRSTPR